MDNSQTKEEEMTNEQADAIEIVCPECGHDIDDHNGDPDEPHTWCAGCDDCRQTPGTIAQALLRAARATTAGANQ